MNPCLSWGIVMVYRHVLMGIMGLKGSHMSKKTGRLVFQPPDGDRKGCDSEEGTLVTCSEPLRRLEDRARQTTTKQTSRKQGNPFL